MLGSINCSKWKWKNFPTAHHGQYIGKKVIQTVTLEAVAEDRLWICHFFFGVTGSNNDINVFEASPILNKVGDASFPVPAKYRIVNTERNKPYFLVDGK